MTGLVDEIQRLVTDFRDGGLEREFVEILGASDNLSCSRVISVEGVGVDVVNFCSNDYLRLSRNFEVRKSMMDCVRSVGIVGSSGTRNISGNLTLHGSLERDIADLHLKESAVLFNSAYLANVGALSVIGSKLSGVCFFSDSMNHASMIHGMRLSRADKMIYEHGDLAHLEELLAGSSCKYKVIVLESVFSMSGLVSDLVRVVDLAKKYDCLVYLDEVHAVGLYGGGRGMAHEKGVAGEIDIINGTFGKAFGCLGGYVTASRVLCDFIKFFASTFIFTTSLPPSLCGAASASIRVVLQDGEGIRRDFFENVRRVRELMDKSNVRYLKGESHVTLVPLGGELGGVEIVKRISAFLMKERSLYVQPIFYPTVPCGRELLRITVSPYHSLESMESLAKGLRVAIDECGMAPQVRFGARGSLLSRVQSGLYIDRFLEKYPQARVKFEACETHGDRNALLPIHQLDCPNAFTKEIEMGILRGDYDAGISSVKDIETDADGSCKPRDDGMLVGGFVPRDDLRDVLILSREAIERVYKNPESEVVLRIGTSSARRQYLMKLVEKCVFPKNARLESVSIRGNVGTRIGKVSGGVVDGVIVALCGVSRLLSPACGKYDAQGWAEFRDKMKGKFATVLAASAFPTAPGQGGVALQYLADSSFSKMLDAFADKRSERQIIREKGIFRTYGRGCGQAIGVSTVEFRGREFTFVKGITDEGNEADRVIGDSIPVAGSVVDTRKFSMGTSAEGLGIMRYKVLDFDLDKLKGFGRFFVAHYRALTMDSPRIREIIDHLRSGCEVWTSGPMTQRKLAEAGLVCNGSVDSMGYNSLRSMRPEVMNFLGDTEGLGEFCVLTYGVGSGISSEFPGPVEGGVSGGARDCDARIETYEVDFDRESDAYRTACECVATADVVIWSSVIMFDIFYRYCRKSVRHISLLGNTYDHITSRGVEVEGYLNFRVIDELLLK